MVGSDVCAVKAFAGFTQLHSLQSGLGDDLRRVICTEFCSGQDCLDLSSSRAVHEDLLRGACLSLHGEDCTFCFGNLSHLAKPTTVFFSVVANFDFPCCRGRSFLLACPWSKAAPFSLQKALMSLKSAGFATPSLLLPKPVSSVFSWFVMISNSYFFLFLSA